MFTQGQLEAIIELLKTNESRILLENAPKEQEKEQIMKYHNITIFKNKQCKTYYCRYRKNGKQHYISAKTQQECLEILKERLELTPKIKKNIITFMDWYNQWFKLFKQNKIKQTTICEYNTCIKKLESIKNKDIKQISSIDIINILENINAERSKQKVYEFLKTIFNKAQDYGIIKNNIKKE